MLFSSEDIQINKKIIQMLSKMLTLGLYDYDKYSNLPNINYFKDSLETIISKVPDWSRDCYCETKSRSSILKTYYIYRGIKSITVTLKHIRYEPFKILSKDTNTVKLVKMHIFEVYLRDNGYYVYNPGISDDIELIDYIRMITKLNNISIDTLRIDLGMLITFNVGAPNCIDHQDLGLYLAENVGLSDCKGSYIHTTNVKLYELAMDDIVYDFREFSYTDNNTHKVIEELCNLWSSYYDIVLTELLDRWDYIITLQSVSRGCPYIDGMVNNLVTEEAIENYIRNDISGKF